MTATVMLRTGRPVDRTVAGTCWQALQALYRTDPMALFELARLARDPRHQLFDGTAEVLLKFALVDLRGRLHVEVRDLVLAAVVGDGVDMALVDPFVREA